MKEKKQHVALYRAYRPAGFADVRGQDQVVNVLKKAIENKQIGHAYLFAGGRGTGKTSVARIFARAIGCSDKDLYEIDAASNRGIDDIRLIRDGVHTAPFESPYKVYIIDEVHMLTKEAFNALLKTLEEPPAHAVFILATTEKDRVPDTIQSRCEVYTFKQPSRELLAERVMSVAKAEGYTMEEPAADLVALLAQGSFRDALSVLQKVLTVATGKKVNMAEVEEVTGAPRGELLNQTLEALAASDVNAALVAIRTARDGGSDMRLFAELLMARVRTVLFVQFAPDLAEAAAKEFRDEDFAIIKKIAAVKTKSMSPFLLRALLTAHADMAYAVVPELPLELAVIETLNS